MGSLPLYLSASAPLLTADGHSDVKAVNALVRDLITALPVGALLDEQARETLRAVHPFARGEVDADTPNEAFQETWEALQSHFPPDIGVRFGIGDPEAPKLLFKRDPSKIAPKRRRIRLASDFLYGPRR
jgi:hypothetical protein